MSDETPNPNEPGFIDAWARIKKRERYKDYLGDGVYVEWDGWHIWLLTETHDPVWNLNRIALEPGVMNALIEYSKRVYGTAKEE